MMKTNALFAFVFVCRKSVPDSGERTLRSTPDWAEAAINGDHLWVPTSVSGDFCYVGDNDCTVSASTYLHVGIESHHYLFYTHAPHTYCMDLFWDFPAIQFNIITRYLLMHCVE